MKKIKKHKITFQKVSIKDLIAAYVIFLLFATIPNIVLMHGGQLALFTNSNFIWYLIYWFIVTLIFIGLISYQKHVLFDQPVSQLNEATRQVAQGDFSVYLEPGHAREKYNDLDYVFENFNLMIEELGSTETLKNDFIANVSHEFKAPLAVIRSYAEALKNETDEEQRDMYTQIIVDETDKMATMVTNVLKLSKIENQALQPHIKKYNVSRQLVETLLNFEKVWASHNISLDINIPDDIEIAAGPEMMELVWQNLLSNAFKFVPSGGQVTLRLQQNNEGTEITVRDNGEGMDHNTLNRIFDKFYQGETSHTNQGNGLGLSLVNRIVTLMQGSISVESKLGKGSAFTVWLPLHHLNN